MERPGHLSCHLLLTATLQPSTRVGSLFAFAGQSDPIAVRNSIKPVATGWHTWKSVEKLGLGRSLQDWDL